MPTLASPVPTPRTPLRRLPATAGWSFLVAGFAARLPQAMVPMGTLLLVASATGSYAAAGLAVAAWSAGCAVGGPAIGALADRYGHRAVGLAAATGNSLAMAAVVALTWADLPQATTLATAAAVGITNPQTGSLARHRWALLARDRSDRRGFVGTAMAYEGAADETSFVLGPVLVGVIAALTAPTVPLLAAAALCLAGQVTFALHRTAPAGRITGQDATPGGPLPWRALAPVAVVLAATGTIFGSTQTGLTAVLGEGGDGALTGPVYAALGVTSGVAGLLTTLLPARFRLRGRIVTSAAALAVLLAPLPFASTPVTLALGCALGGLAIAPMMISAYALAERTTPSGRGTTVMTVLATAGTVGVAAGSSVAGRLADTFGGAAALALPSIAALLALTSALATRRTPS